ncbi:MULTISPECIES: hypothetical protein [Bradyrhizobium]|nr:hypothetical protein [Bradyrhizobium japonicum]WLB85896.1 hypothetical protein QIH91_23360 [Bradyrhizobium japonicum USDA 135]
MQSLAVKVGPMDITASGVTGCGFVVLVILILSWMTKAVPPFVF